MDSLRPGDPVMVGRYRLVGRLGAGGMGQVFLGTSPGGRQVAVKLIHPDHAGTAQFRERFAREIAAGLAEGLDAIHACGLVHRDLKPSNVTLIRYLSGGGYGFAMPSGVAVHGTHVWITNISGNSMDELDAGTGSLERTLTAPRYGFDSPNSLLITGDHAWIGNWHSPGGHGSVTELTLG